jgi:hypothetical protein
MSTRTVAGKIEGLIEEASALEELGKPIQATDEATGTEAATELDRRYRTWYAASLSVLPDDLKEKFRFEFDGNFFQARVKKFLEQPRLRSTLFESMQEETRAALNLSPWQHPFNDTFRGPLLTQKQLLIEALARYGIGTTTIEGLALLEQLTRRLPISFAVLRREVQKRPGIQIVDE